MTPQTLINDLSTENCDARDIVLIVIGPLSAVNYVGLLRETCRRGA